MTNIIRPQADGRISLGALGVQPGQKFQVDHDEATGVIVLTPTGDAA